MPRPPFKTAALAAALAAATLAAGCGSDDGGEDESSAARPAPPASEFPAANGQSLEQLLGASA